jgi:membrane protease YdiL (CAAX protease family)
MARVCPTTASSTDWCRPCRITDRGLVEFVACSLIFIAPSATGNVPLVWYIPLVTGWGVLFAWLYNRTQGSVMLSMLLHAGINFVLGALGLLTLSPRRQPLTIFVVLMCVLAVLAFQRLERARNQTSVEG